MQKSVMASVMVCGAAFIGTGCSSPAVPLGDAYDKVGVEAASSGGSATQGNEPDGSTASSGGASNSTSSGGASNSTSSGGAAPITGPTSDRVPLAYSGGRACEMAEQFPSTDDAWWTAHWTHDAPSLPLPICGTSDDFLTSTPTSHGSGPAVVARWVAPHDGTYYARGWAKDFNGVFSGTRDCGIADGCAELNPQVIPAAPFQLGSEPPGAGFNLDAKAGDVWFFWFQDLDPTGAPPPDHGTAVANISTVGF